MRRVQVLYQRAEPVVLGSLGLAGFVALWEIAVRAGWVNPLLAGSPSIVVRALGQWAASGQLRADLLTSLGELLVAFGAAAAIGVAVGFAMGWHRRTEYALDPFVWVLHSAPLVSFWPLFIIWLGIGSKAIIALAFFLAVVPVIINTITGVRGVDAVLIRCARSFNAGGWDLFSKFVLPAALPLIIAGWRLAVGRALIGVVVGEMFSANAGLGYHISYYGARLKLDHVFAAVAVVVVFGVASTQAIRLLEARLSRWRD